MRSDDKRRRSGARGILVELHTADWRCAPLLLGLFLTLSRVQYPARGGLFGGTHKLKSNMRSPASGFTLISKSLRLAVISAVISRILQPSYSVVICKTLGRVNLTKYGLDVTVRSETKGRIIVVFKINK